MIKSGYNNKNTYDYIKNTNVNKIIKYHYFPYISK